MSEHFVKHIKIERYKCFDGFSAVGFGRVNLISGKNNVGKTAFMEALLISVNAKNNKIQSLFNSLDFINTHRDKTDQNHKPSRTLESLKLFVDLEITTNTNSLTCRTNDSQVLVNFEISVNGKTTEISEADVKEYLTNLSTYRMEASYIGSVRDSQEEIIHSFKAVQKKDREPEVNSLINSFDESIENVKPMGGDSIEFKVIDSEGNSSYRRLGEFGDGLRHYISIISDLYAVEGKYIFIDEIDNGIHYSSLDQLWEIILNLSKELNVQVFATTHSRECIESYNRVAQKLEDEDISFTTLVKNKEKVVKAIVRDYELFTNSMRDEREVRGW